MILVDTSGLSTCVSATLTGLLWAGQVLTHPFVIGELALGNLRQREIVLGAMSDLPRATIATDAEVLHFIDRREIYRRSVGWVAAHLLAAALLTHGMQIWSDDKRLRNVAIGLGLAMPVSRGQG